MNTVTLRLRAFFSDTFRRRSLYLALLLIGALADYAASGKVARSFEFRSLRDGRPVVERRFLRRSATREESVGAYVAEYLLGPSDIDSAYLFDRGSSVRTVILRGRVAHVDLSAAAAFPAERGVDVRTSLNILISGIKRNFPNIKHAAVYIEGHEPYAISDSGGSGDGSVPKTGKSVDK